MKRRKTASGTAGDTGDSSVAVNARVRVYPGTDGEVGGTVVEDFREDMTRPLRIITHRRLADQFKSFGGVHDWVRVPEGTVNSHEPPPMPLPGTMTMPLPPPGWYADLGGVPPHRPQQSACRSLGIAVAVAPVVVAVKGTGPNAPQEATHHSDTRHHGHQNRRN